MRFRFAQMLIADFDAEPRQEFVADENLAGRIRIVAGMRARQRVEIIAGIRVSDLFRDIVRKVRSTRADADVPSQIAALRTRCDRRQQQTRREHRFDYNVHCFLHSSIPRTAHRNEALRRRQPRVRE